jgi:hypothetical protein
MRGCIRREILIDSIACGGGEPAGEAEIRSMAARRRARTAAMFPKCPLQGSLDYRLQKFQKVLCCQCVEDPFFQASAAPRWRAQLLALRAAAGAAHKGTSASIPCTREMFSYSDAPDQKTSISKTHTEFAQNRPLARKDRQQDLHAQEVRVVGGPVRKSVFLPTLS